MAIKKLFVVVFSFLLAACIDHTHAQWIVSATSNSNESYYALAVNMSKPIGVKYDPTGGRGAVHMWRDATWNYLVWDYIDYFNVDDAIAYAGDGPYYGGAANGHAVLWTDGHIVADLHPDGARSSVVRSIRGQWQGGSTTYRPVWDYVTHAGMWNGTRESWIDLHPAGAAASSAIYAMDAECQVGLVDGQAVLWMGTAASCISLHPSGTVWSAALAIAEGQQAGFTAGPFLSVPTDRVVVSLFDDLWPGSFGQEAALWEGTPESWVNLTSNMESCAYGAFGGYQVGYVSVQDGGHRAAIWNGSAESLVDLHALLPDEYTRSIARGISSDGEFLYVVGYGEVGVTGRVRALLWMRPIDAPCASDINGDGQSDILDFLDFINAFGVCNQQPGPCEPYGVDVDFNADTLVDVLDLLDFLDNFSQGCG
jgi:hypothetical protein